MTPAPPPPSPHPPTHSTGAGYDGPRRQRLQRGSVCVWERRGWEEGVKGKVLRTCEERETCSRRRVAQSERNCVCVCVCVCSSGLAHHRRWPTTAVPGRRAGVRWVAPVWTVEFGDSRRGRLGGSLRSAAEFGDSRQIGDSRRKRPQRGSQLGRRASWRRGGKPRAAYDEGPTPCAGAAPQSLPSHGSNWYCQLEDANGTATGPDLPFSLMPRLGQGTGPRCATAIGAGFMQYPRPAKGLQDSDLQRAPFTRSRRADA